MPYVLRVKSSQARFKPKEVLMNKLAIPKVWDQFVTEYLGTLGLQVSAL